MTAQQAMMNRATSICSIQKHTTGEHEETGSGMNPASPKLMRFYSTTKHMHMNNFDSIPKHMNMLIRTHIRQVIGEHIIPENITRG